MLVPRSVPPALAVGQALLLALMPHGGQHTSRRNAWAGLAGDAQRTRARRDATQAMDAAIAAANARRAGTAAAAR